MRLHNWIVDFDLKHHNRQPPGYDFDDDILEYMRSHPGDVVDIFRNNLQDPVRGATSNHDLVMKRIGEAV